MLIYRFLHKKAIFTKAIPCPKTSFASGGTQLTTTTSGSPYRPTTQPRAELAPKEPLMVPATSIYRSTPSQGGPAPREPPTTCQPRSSEPSCNQGQPIPPLNSSINPHYDWPRNPPKPSSNIRTRPCHTTPSEPPAHLDITSLQPTCSNRRRETHAISTNHSRETYRSSVLILLLIRGVLKQEKRRSKKHKKVTRG